MIKILLLVFRCLLVQSLGEEFSSVSRSYCWILLQKKMSFISHCSFDTFFSIDIHLASIHDSLKNIKRSLEGGLKKWCWWFFSIPKRWECFKKICICRPMDVWRRIHKVKLFMSLIIRERDNEIHQLIWILEYKTKPTCWGTKKSNDDFLTHLSFRTFWDLLDATIASQRRQIRTFNWQVDK